MDNLGTPSGNSSSRRPHQKGKVKGKKNGRDVEAPKEWLIDSGADVSAITKSNADKFDLKPAGGSASSTTGGGGIIMKSGLVMVFKIIGADGNEKEVTCDLPVAVKPNNAGSEILGMDQVAKVNAMIEWNPVTRKGKLKEIPS